ncbi:hypothetical protein Naga_101165g1 [Nannochloropsis gaditana]|uniref:Uncharacterized protein n=1 Tax=Nannochloropsis gaditana TaxID=72520 RepID=W7TJG4_9STRA|nr:hypothetical protein Naga_101165g1 [Nannochloropsis gaditana]
MGDSSVYITFIYTQQHHVRCSSQKGFSRAEAMKKLEGKGGGNETSSLGNRRGRWRGRAEEKPQKIESRGKGERQGRNARACVGNERRCMEGKSGTGAPETFVFKFFKCWNQRGTHACHLKGCLYFEGIFLPFVPTATRFLFNMYKHFVLAFYPGSS